MKKVRRLGVSVCAAAEIIEEEVGFHTAIDLKPVKSDGCFISLIAIRGDYRGAWCFLFARSNQAWPSPRHYVA